MMQTLDGVGRMIGLIIKQFGFISLFSALKSAKDKVK
jgi:hypothetical protein